MLGMPSCREVTLAVGGEELEGASLGRRIMVHVHTLACRHCRRYAAQVRTLGEAARALATSAGRSGSVERLRRLILAELEPSDSG